MLEAGRDLISDKLMQKLLLCAFDGKETTISFHHNYFPEAPKLWHRAADLLAANVFPTLTNAEWEVGTSRLLQLLSWACI